MNLLFVRVVKANGTYVAPAFTPSGNELYSIYYAHILDNIPIGHNTHQSALIEHRLLGSLWIFKPGFYLHPRCSSPPMIHSKRSDPLIFLHHPLQVYRHQFHLN